MGNVEFEYWNQGYSCPKYGDSVSCKVEVRSQLGSVVVVQVKFVAMALSSEMLHWVGGGQSGATVELTFPSVDGGARDSLLDR